MTTVKVIKYWPTLGCHECIDQDNKRRMLDLITSGCLEEDIDPESLIGKSFEYEYDHPWISFAEGVKQI